MATAYSVKTTYTAVDHVSEVMGRMAARHAAMARGMGAQLASVARGVGGLADRAKAAAMALGGIGMALGGAAFQIGKIGVDFERELVSAAVKMPGAIRPGTEAFEALRAKAAEVGATTKFTASEAASGLKYLAMAGFTAEEAMAALPAVASMATAAEVDLKTASDMATDAVGAMGLASGTAAERAASLTYASNLMTVASTSANFSFEQLFESITKVGPVAADAKIPMQDMTAALAVMANAGIKAEVAGTHLKIMFTRLRTEEGADALKKYGIEVKRTAEGTVDFIGTMQRFKAGLGELSDKEKSVAMDAVFGRNAIASASAVMAASDGDLVKFQSRFSDVGGAVAEMNAVMGETADAKIKGLMSAIEGLGLALFEQGAGALKTTVDGWTTYARALGTAMANNQGLTGQLAGSVIGVLFGLGQTIVGLVGAYASLKAIQWSITALQYTWNAALAVGNGIMWLRTAATTAAAAVTTFYNFGLAAGIAVLLGQTTATEAATFAQAGLNLAMLANPAMWIATGLMAVVGIVLYLTGALGFLTKAFGFLWQSSSVAATGMGQLTDSAGTASDAVGRLAAQVNAPWPAINIPVNYIPGQMPGQPGAGSYDHADWKKDFDARVRREEAAEEALASPEGLAKWQAIEKTGALQSADAAAQAWREAQIKAHGVGSMKLESVVKTTTLAGDDVPSTSERAGGVGGTATIKVQAEPGTKAAQKPGGSLRGVGLDVPRTGGP